MAILHHRRDALLLAVALAQGAVTAAAIAGCALHPGAALPSLAAVAILAVGLWWSSNTVAHNHLHNPLFRRGPANRAFSLYLSALTGVPQSIWRARHLAHHAGASQRRQSRLLDRASAIELGVIALTWAALAGAAPALFCFIYLPGYALGMLLCQGQGYFEHRRRAVDGISHYGALYNRLWFNDGYHAEHHARPAAHWTRLPSLRAPDNAALSSRWPPMLRWLEGAGLANRIQAHALVALEHLALRFGFVRRFMVDRHLAAFARLLPEIVVRGPLDRIAVVGGGLFPRTAVVLRRLLPDCRITVIDASPRSIALGRAWLDRHLPGHGVDFVEARYDAARCDLRFDLIVLPLGYLGDRRREYQAPSAPSVVIHDWLWRARGDRTAIVSRLLCKRLNLVLR